MGSFKEDYEKRLRRVCGVTDDTLAVSENSETVYEGYCDTCRYETEVIVVRVTRADGSEVARQEFGSMGTLMRYLDEVEL